MRRRTVHAIIDTNFLLHFRALDSIPWRQILSADTVDVVLSSVVLDELSKHTTVANEASRKLRQRATAVGKRLRQLLIGQKGRTILREKEALCFAEPVRDADYARLDLDRGLRDNELLALALLYRAKRRSVVLVTDDLTLQLRAEGRGIAVLPPADDLRLPEEPDPLEKELKELRAVPRPKLELLQIALREDKLTHPLLLPIGDHVYREAVTIEEEWADLALATTLNRRSNEIDPILYEEELYREGEGAKEAVRWHLMEFSRAVQIARTYLARLTKTIRVPLGLANTGSGPAEGIRVILAIHRGDLVEVSLGLPDPPPLPERHFHDDSIAGIGSGFRSLVRRPAELETGLAIAATSRSQVKLRILADLGECYVVEHEFPKVQHDLTLRLPDLFIEFGAREHIKPLQILGRVHADNLANAQEQRVNVLAEPFP